MIDEVHPDEGCISYPERGFQSLLNETHSSNDPASILGGTGSSKSSSSLFACAGLTPPFVTVSVSAVSAAFGEGEVMSTDSPDRRLSDDLLAIMVTSA